MSDQDQGQRQVSAEEGEAVTPTAAPATITAEAETPQRPGRSEGTMSQSPRPESPVPSSSRRGLPPLRPIHELDEPANKRLRMSEDDLQPTEEEGKNHTRSIVFFLSNN